MIATGSETGWMFPTETGIAITQEPVTVQEPVGGVDMGLRPSTSSSRGRKASVVVGSILGILLSGSGFAEEPIPADASSWLSGRLTLRLSPEFTSGDYGESRTTDVWYVPLAARFEFSDFDLTPYSFDRVSLGLTVPFVRVDGPGGVVVGTGGPVVVRGKGQGGGSGGPTTTTSTQSDEHGLGDILVSAAYRALSPPDSRLPWLTLAGKIKIPTASESDSLGTGEADYTLFAEVYQPLERVGFFVGGGYRFMGDPDEFDLKNRWLAAAGFEVLLSESVAIGLTYDYREAAARSVSDAHEFSPWLSITPAGGLNIQPYGLIGASDGSPEYGVGVRLAWSIEVDSRRDARSRLNVDRDL